jgi:hypothetical protein
MLSPILFFVRTFSKLFSLTILSVDNINAASVAPPAAPPANWSPDKIVCFLQCMERILDDGGSTADNGFKGPQWKSIQVDFNNRMNVNFTLSQLQNKYSDLKKRYKTFNELVDNSGFGWNEEAMRPTAPPDVWDVYLINKPDARPYRNASLPNFLLCEKIWGGKVATGNFAIYLQLSFLFISANTTNIFRISYPYLVRPVLMVRTMVAKTMVSYHLFEKRPKTPSPWSK